MPRSEERESKFKILTLLRIIMDFLKKLKGNLFFFMKMIWLSIYGDIYKSN